MYFIGAPLGLNKDVRARKLGKMASQEKEVVRDTSFRRRCCVSVSVKTSLFVSVYTALESLRTCSLPFFSVRDLVDTTGRVCLIF